MKNICPNTVYKYTTYDTFKKIIIGKKLRLTNIKKSNDATELILVYEIVKKVFEEEFLRNKPKYIDQYFPKEEFDKFFVDNTDQINWMEKMFNTQYVTCFSKDGDMLSQWRGYGDDGKGISIGFDTSTLVIDDIYKFGYVRYCEKRQKALFRSKIKEIIKEIRGSVKYNKSISEYSVKEFIEKYNEMLIDAVYVKNQFFHEEKEWRYSFWYKNILEFKDVNISTNSISKVIIGPKCNVTKEEIQKFLTNNGYNNVEVTFSRGHNVYVESDNWKKII